jgi:rare lipoprotein A
MTLSVVRSIRTGSLLKSSHRIVVVSVLCLLTLGTCISVAQAETGSSRSEKLEATAEKTFSGNISWYGSHFNGRKTASGEIFDMSKRTAAHRSLAFSSKVMVEDPRTGGSVVVKVNDRGPFVKSRVMDISRGAANTLGTLNRGVTYVDCTVLAE